MFDSVRPALSKWQLFEKALVASVLIDLALGGNGYLINLAGFRLREIFFGVCLVWVVLRLTIVEPIKLDRTSVLISTAFVLITALGTLIGYLEGATKAAILAELKPLSYFGMLPFFLVAIRNRADVRLTALILIVCGTLLALAYLLLLAALAFDLLSYVAVYELLRASDEFIFRHNPNGPFIGFFYKGAFYICIAAILLLFDPYKGTKVLAALCIIAAAMTLTRGVAGALFIAIGAGIFLASNWRRSPMLAGQAVMLLAVLFFAQKSETALLVASGDVAEPDTGSYWGSRVAKEKASGKHLAKKDNGSIFNHVARPTDAQRWDDLKFIADHTDAQVATVGKGLGMPIGKRTRIEMTYPEIFYKQGIIGLAFWLSIFAYLVWLYSKVPKINRRFAASFLLCGLFVFIATMSNTFLTGSIGMAVVFISLSSLLTLSRKAHVVPR